MKTPEVGKWWYQLSGFVPMGCCDTREDAIREGKERAAKNGFYLSSVGKWVNKVVPGNGEFVKKDEK